MPLIYQILIALFSLPLLKPFGTLINNLVTPSNVSVQQVVPDGTPGSSAREKPTFGEVAKDAVNNPTSMWAVAGIGFVAVFLIAQLRAASHEAGTAAVGVYNEAKDVTRKVAKPNTQNQSRFVKGGD